MKKFIYSIAIVLLTSLALSSCTEEEVKPNLSGANAGGSGRTGELAS